MQSDSAVLIFLLSAFETSEHYVIAMEYLPGGELFDYILERNGLTETAAKEIFRQLARAVQHCHNVSNDLAVE